MAWRRGEAESSGGGVRYGDGCVGRSGWEKTEGGARVGESGLSSSASHQTRLGKPRGKERKKKRRIKATVEDKIIIA